MERAFAERAVRSSPLVLFLIISLILFGFTRMVAFQWRPHMSGMAIWPPPPEMLYILHQAQLSLSYSFNQVPVWAGSHQSHGSKQRFWFKANRRIGGQVGRALARRQRRRSRPPLKPSARVLRVIWPHGTLVMAADRDSIMNRLWELLNIVYYTK